MATLSDVVVAKLPEDINVPGQWVDEDAETVAAAAVRRGSGTKESAPKKKKEPIVMEEIFDEQFDVVPSRILLPIAVEVWRTAWKVRERHPDWTPEQVGQQILDIELPACAEPMSRHPKVWYKVTDPRTTEEEFNFLVTILTARAAVQEGRITEEEAKKKVTEGYWRHKNLPAIIEAAYRAEQEKRSAAATERKKVRAAARARARDKLAKAAAEAEGKTASAKAETPAEPAEAETPAELVAVDT